MKKITKRILIASAVTAGTGVVFMGVGIALGGWPGVVFTKGGIHSPYEQKTPYRQEKKEIEPFSELSLYVGSEADVVVTASKDEKYYVEYTLAVSYTHLDVYKRQDRRRIGNSGCARRISSVYSLAFVCHCGGGKYSLRKKTAK